MRNKTHTNQFTYILLLLSVFNCIPKNNFSKEKDPSQKAKAVLFVSQTKQLGFTENKGQMQDDAGNPTPYVLYKATAPGLNVWITTSGITYQFLKFDENDIDDKIKKTYSWHRVDMILKDGKIMKENVITEGDITQGKKDYYLAHCPDGVFDVKTFSKITIKNIYEGIDWIIYSKDNSIKYDFVIHPNADANQIKLIYEGSGKFEVLNSNQIHFENEIGEIQEGKLFCYQGSESNEVKSKYTIKKIDNRQEAVNNASRLEIFSYEIGIQLNNYDKSKTLTIDPQLSWSTFFGGSDWDAATSTDCDANNNLLVTGYSLSTDFPLLNAGGTSYYQGVNTGADYDAFITQFTPLGVLLWSTYYGGSVTEWGNTITVAPSGEIYVVGHTTSANLPLLNLPGAYNQAVNNQTTDPTDGFILKFSNTGTRLWATYFGGNGNDWANSVVVNNAGNVFVAGTTTSTNLPVVNPGGGAYYNPVSQTGGVTNDAFVAQFNNAGAQVWTTYFGGVSNEEGNAICLDPTGNIFITGGTASNNFPILTPAGSYSQPIGGGLDMYVIQFSNTGVHLWSTFYGGTVNDAGFSIASDLLGNIFVSGFTDSNNFPTLNPGGGAYYQAAFGGSGAFPWIGDAVIVKFNNAGARQWATYYGGSNGDKANADYDGIAIDACNNVYVSMYTSSTDMPVKNPNCATDYFDATYNGGTRDVFIAKFTNMGIHLWGTYFGGDADDVRGGLAIDNFNHLYVAGGWRGAALTSNTYPTLNPGAGAFFDASHNGNGDAYVAKFLQSVASTATSSLVNATACVCNGSATVVVTCSAPPYNYVWSNNSQSLNDTNNTNTISNLCPGIYTVTVTSNCNQPIQAVFNITGPGGTNIFVTQNPVICTGQTYTLPDGDTTSIAGTYTDTLLTGSGCDSIVTTNLTVTNVISTTLSPIICSGQSYTFPDNSSSDTAYIYIDTITSVGGCDSIITISLTVTPPPTITQNQSICSGQTYTLPGGAIVNLAGNYPDTIQTTQGCDSIIITNLTVNNLPNAVGGASQNIPCNPNSVSISASSSTAGVNYNWTGPGTITNDTTNNPTVNAAGTYTVTVTDSNGCTNTSTVTVTNNNPLPNANASGTTIPCTQTTDTITASSTTAGATYSWSGPGIISGGTTSNPTVNAAGTYTVIITDPSTGCTNTATATVTVISGPTASVSPDITIISGTSTVLTASGGINYNWTPTTNLSSSTGTSVTATPTETTTYCVEVTDNNGCKDTACVTVTIELPCPENENLQVPNAFSPNADGVNDEFCLQGWEACLESFSIIIFDRWGEKVYESNDPAFCWEGKSRGIIMDAQVFVYYIKARFTNIEKTIILKGNISLLR